MSAGKVPAGFDRVCVEGDTAWIVVPRGEETDGPGPEEAPGEEDEPEVPLFDPGERHECPD